MALRSGKFFHLTNCNLCVVFSFFVPAPIISLEGNGWVNKMRELQRFYEKQAKQRKIDVSILPPPTIEGTIAVHEVSDHPVLNFELNNSAVSL